MHRQSEKNLLSSNISSTCPHNMVDFGLLTAEIVSGVWGTPATFKGFRVLAALMHGSQVVSVSQTLRRWTEGATYVRQGDHHVGHWPTFLVVPTFVFFGAGVRARCAFLTCSLSPVLFMVALYNRADHYILILFLSFFFLLLLLFFLAYYQQSESGCLPYFHTWCGVSANL